MMPSRNNAPQSGLGWVFIGSDGLRAGWGLLIYVAIIGSVGIALKRAAQGMLGPDALHPTGDLSPFALLFSEAFTAAGVIGMSRLMGRIERRPFWSYGLAPRGALVNIVMGLLCGFIALSILIGMLYIGGFLLVDGLALHGPAIAANGALLLGGFALVGLAEEGFFRGYILSTLERGIGFWPGAVVSSTFFAAAHIHNTGETPLGIAQVFVAGMLFCALLRMTGSLWLGIGFHTTWDWAQSYFYGTPDSGLMFQGRLLLTHAAGNPQFSGGAAGPEGSVLATPVLIGGLAAMAWLYRNAKGREV